MVTLDTDLAIAGIVLGLVAIIMAAPPLIQMLGGAPALKLTFIGGRYQRHPNMLSCEITNNPITNRLLKLLKVPREEAEISVTFAIYERGSGRLVADTTFAPLHGVTPASQRVQRVRADEIAIFHVIAASSDQTARVIRREGMDGEIVLPYGRYEISIHLNDERRGRDQEIKKEFIIGKSDSELRLL